MKHDVVLFMNETNRDFITNVRASPGIQQVYKQIQHVSVKTLETNVAGVREK